MEQREEEELLALVKSWMGRIPFDLDILILDEIGKNISGAGMDTKVVNRGVQGEYNPWPQRRSIERIFVRDISDLSYNNGVGLGMADVVTTGCSKRSTGIRRRSTPSRHQRRALFEHRSTSRRTVCAWRRSLPQSASST